MTIRVIPRVGPFVFVRIPRQHNIMIRMMAVAIVCGMVWPIQALVFAVELFVLAVVKIARAYDRQQARRTL